MYLYLFIGWVVYFFIHSFLAANATKQWCEEKIPSIKKYYRILYNLLVFFSLLPLLYFTSKDTNFVFIPSFLIKITAIVCIIIGLATLMFAFVVFDRMEFLGFKLPESNQDAKLIISGIYHYVRHPLYTGIFFLLLGLFLWKPSIAVILFSITTIVYIEIGSRLEEQKLIDYFGQSYIDYRKQAKRYFPFIY